MGYHLEYLLLYWEVLALERVVDEGHDICASQISSLPLQAIWAYFRGTRQGSSSPQTMTGALAKLSFYQRSMPVYGKKNGLSIF